MRERSSNEPNYLKLGIEFLLAVPFLSFSQPQKEWIRERDQNQCQAKGIIPHRCCKERHVHHLLPQGYAAKLDIDPDYPTNGILICENAHKTVHPDMAQASIDYANNKQSFAQLHDERRVFLDAHSPYWVTTWDRPLYAKAVKNTQVYIKNNPEKHWPEKANSRNGRDDLLDSQNNNDQIEIGGENV